MRLPFQRHNQRQPLEVKMTPMIDVIFLLLIFFVCTVSFRAVEELLPTNLHLPGALASEAPPDEELRDLDEVIIEILWDGRRAHWRINKRDYTELASVHATLAQIARVKNDLPVILDVDGNVPLEKVIDIYDACRRTGLQRIQFAASEQA